MTVLGPSTPTLLDPNARPYFLWWTELTVREFRRRVAEGDPAERAYWVGALLR